MDLDELSRSRTVRAPRDAICGQIGRTPIRTTPCWRRKLPLLGGSGAGQSTPSKRRPGCEQTILRKLSTFQSQLRHLKEKKLRGATPKNAPGLNLTPFQATRTGPVPELVLSQHPENVDYLSFYIFGGNLEFCLRFSDAH